MAIQSAQNFVNEPTIWQWATEATRGTDLAATSKMLTNGMDPEGDDVLERPDLQIGIGAANVGLESISSRGTTITIPDFSLCFEQAHIWGGMWAKGGISPSGSDPYTYAMARALAADPVLDSKVFERRLTDGVNNLDYAWHYVLLSEFGFKWNSNPGSYVMANAKAFARARKSETLTPALTAPTPEWLLSENMLMYIDSVWGSLGSTQVLGQIVEGEFKCTTGYSFYKANDGRVDLDLSSYYWNPKAFTYTLNVTMLLQNSAQYATELAAAEAGTRRAIRLKNVGSDGATNRLFQVDGLYTHNKGALPKIEDWNGQSAVKLQYVQSTDGTNLLAHTVINHKANTN